MQSVNLMPVEMQRRRFLLDRARVWALMLGVCAGLLITSYQILSTRVSRYDALLEGGELLQIELAEARSRMEKIRARRVQFMKEHDTVELLVRAGAWEDTLRDITTLTTDDIWISGLRIRSGQPSSALRSRNAASMPACVVRLELTGYAVSNAAFAEFRASLNQSPRIQNVEPVNVRAAKLLKGRLIEFTMKGRLIAPDVRRGTRAAGSLPSPLDSATPAPSTVHLEHTATHVGLVGYEERAGV